MGKRKRNPFFALTALLPLFLTGCTITIQPVSSSIPSSESSSSSSDFSSEEMSSSSEATSETTSEGTSLDSSTSESSSEESISDPRPAETFEFYAVNDFHGSVVYNGTYEVGAASYFSYLKQRKDADPDHVILLSSGDMWQGSYESNVNYGNLVTELCNVAGFDAMTLGNHEFDYGRQYLLNNKELADYPFLAANIYKYKDWRVTDEFWSEGADKSVVIERAGYRIGIVGIIGEGQTSSITSDRVTDLAFDDPELHATREARRLKTEEGCDIVILSIHDDAKSILGGSTDSKTYQPWGLVDNLKYYFDGVFCAHTHTENNATSPDGVPLLQAWKNGGNYAHMTLTIDQGKVTCDKAEILTAKNVIGDIDPDIQDKIDEYLTPEVLAKTSQVAGTLSGTLSNTEGVGNLGAAAIYHAYKDKGAILGMQNSQRASLYSGELTYGELYKAMPFTNSIVMLYCSGSEIKREVSYQWVYAYSDTISSTSELDDRTFYWIAVIDFLAYHQSDGHSYNYFPGLNTGADRFGDVYETYPVDLTFDYIKNTLGGVVNSSAYKAGAPGIL